MAASLGPPGALFVEHTGLGDDVFLPEAFFFLLCRGFSSCREQGLVVGRGLLAVAASLAAEHGL